MLTRPVFCVCVVLQQLEADVPAAAVPHGRRQGAHDGQPQPRRRQLPRVPLLPQARASSSPTHSPQPPGRYITNPALLVLQVRRAGEQVRAGPATAQPADHISERCSDQRHVVLSAGGACLDPVPAHRLLFQQDRHRRTGSGRQQGNQHQGMRRRRSSPDLPKGLEGRNLYVLQLSNHMRASLSGS